MKIVFTYNLQHTVSEEEAEFDRPETIDALSAAMRQLGHEVELLEASGPATRLVARLEALSPDIVFNTAEGRTGRYREAFFPALFDQLGLPFTGSDAHVCTVTLDKQLTKLTVAAHGIPTPRWAYFEPERAWYDPELTYPVMVKPNFEGSSKGITQDSIIDDPVALRGAVRDLLTRYPSGVLVEEFITGKDVTVPFLEKASPKTNGVLPPVGYHIDPVEAAKRRYNIYDFDLKQIHSEAVSVHIPAGITPEQERMLLTYSQKIYATIGLRDMGRIDYRITPDGRIYFIEINALPSLEPGSGIYLAAAQAGLPTIADVVKQILNSAALRQNVTMRKNGARKKQTLRVGLTFNLKRIVPHRESDDDSEAEYDSPTTVNAIAEAIASYGHEVIPMEATADFLSVISSTPVDFVFNIAEGLAGRNRESHVPSILELLDIPYTGSDPATLSLALDKGLSKRIVMQSGVSTPKFWLMRTGRERLPRDLEFPVLVKPVAEGSSKGVLDKSVVENEAELREAVNLMNARYHQPVLVEEFLPGREFTLGLLGEYRPIVLPPMEIVFVNQTKKNQVYSFEHKLTAVDEIRYDTPAKVDPALLRDLERVARNSFIALGCRDVGRVDVRLDKKGKVHFIECNPLPGLTPGWSDLCLIAQSANMDYRTLIGEIMAPAIRRLKSSQRVKKGATK
ncbi:MAG TPA: ATP-grasp domain-containing protein [bacterium]|nr:ATP-grasp domain-containing protein [bacterium]